MWDCLYNQATIGSAKHPISHAIFSLDEMVLFHRFPCIDWQLIGRTLKLKMHLASPRILALKSPPHIALQSLARTRSSDLGRTIPTNDSPR
jgi:hypothetical protein